MLLLLISKNFPISFLIMLNCLLWNVRGVARTNFVSSIKILVHKNKMDICVITEPRISRSKALSIARKVGFNNAHFEESRAFLGGILVLWNGVHTKVKLFILTAKLSPW